MELLSDVERQEIHHRQLGGEGLGGGHGDLGTCPGVEHVVGSLGDGASHHVDHGQHPGAPALGLPQGGQGVGGLAGLADDDDQGGVVQHGIGVAELRGQHRLHRHTAEIFDDVLAVDAHIVRRAAGHNVDPPEIFQVFRRELDVVQDNAPLADPGVDGVPHSLGLLVDLLEHEVGVAALLRRGDLPGDVLRLLFHNLPVGVVEGDGVGGHLQKVAVVEVDHIPGVFENGRHVRGDEVAALAVAEDQGTVLLDADDGAGDVRAQYAKGVAAFHPRHSLAHGLAEGSAFCIKVFDEVCHHLGVRLRVKLHALFLEHLFEGEVVFNDAVVHHRKFAPVGHMGVAVLIRGSAVGCPAGVPDAGSARERSAASGEVDEILEPSLDLGHLERCAVIDADPGGVIPPVLQLGEPLEQDGSGLLPSNISYDSTHKKRVPPVISNGQNHPLVALPL